MLRRVVWKKFTDVSEVLAIAVIMETASTSETSANSYHATRRKIPEDSLLFSTLLDFDIHDS
jgi:hypothetical protein